MTGAGPEAVSPPLERLIGAWDFEASVQGRFLGRGSTTFEWIEDGAFVLQHANDEPDPRTSKDWADHSPMPVRAVIGWDDTTDECTQLYSDARGVFRIYRMLLTDEAWTIWREAPGFSQRFVGHFRDESTIAGAWESSPDGTTWEPDFDMVYRKRPRTDDPSPRGQSNRQPTSRERGETS
jgi:hypothetical protein